MDLKTTLKNDMFAAMVKRDTLKKEILQVTLGEVTLRESRSGVNIPDSEVISILKKLVSSNNEVLEYMKTSPDKYEPAKLQREISILETYIPKSLTTDEIVSKLSDELKEEILGTLPNNGKLIGKVIKFLKGLGLQANGEDVKSVIQLLSKE
jgi:uncharacterized protein YqeY